MEPVFCHHHADCYFSYGFLVSHSESMAFHRLWLQYVTVHYSNVQICFVLFILQGLKAVYCCISFNGFICFYNTHFEKLLTFILFYI